MNTDRETKSIVKYNSKVPAGYKVVYTQSGTKLVKDTISKPTQSWLSKLVNGKQAQSGQAAIMLIVVLAALALLLIATGTLDWLVNQSGICTGVLCNM